MEKIKEELIKKQNEAVLEESWKEEEGGDTLNDM